MTNIQLYDNLSLECSRRTTEAYSTSFAGAIKLLHKDLRQPMHNIYGFVRLADEIVDTFHHQNKTTLLQEFKQATTDAIERKFSLNPILNSFQVAVHEYGINDHLINAFLYSMELDLEKKQYDAAAYNEYIYGSAEVVGLMCLQVFCEGDNALYNKLKKFARSLGAAFQKINFLRDIQADTDELGRMYFPNCDFNKFSLADKAAIENDIQKDLNDAYAGIMMLPSKARLGVYVAYKYYLSLFKKIKRLQPEVILQQRVRIPDYIKAIIVARAGITNTVAFKFGIQNTKR